MKSAVKGKKSLSINKLAGVDDRTLEDLVDVFKSLSDRWRLLILMLLAREGEMHVKAIGTILGQSQPAVSHHLTQLKNAGLVNYRRDGKFNFYAIDSELADQILGKFFPGASSTQQKFTFGDLELMFKTR
jgi:ArsR family transcriptional regulator, arsenate/arsenite/antimonite-responsive transcriptional repressor